MGSLCTTLSAGSCVAPSGSPAVLNANGGITGTGGAYYQYLYGRTLNNAGTANFGNHQRLLYLPQLRIGDQQPGGATWNQTVDNGYLAVTGTGGTFNNAGTFAKTGGTGTSQVQPLFNNTGTVQANTGTLSFSNVATSGAPWSVASGSDAEPLGGIGQHSHIERDHQRPRDGGPGSQCRNVEFDRHIQRDRERPTDSAARPISARPVTNVGLINVSGGTLNFTNAITNNPGSVGIGNGLVNFSTGSPITLGTLTLNSSGAALVGTDTVTVTGLFTWAGGSLCTTLSAGSCVAPSGSPAILNANGGITGTGGAYYQFLYGRTLNNAGTANFGNTNGYFTYLNFGSVINNQAGATWNQTVDNGYLAVAGTGGTFNNAGTFAKTGGTGTSQVQPIFNNTGTAQVNTGTLSFSNVATSSAPWSMAAGTTLNLSAGSGNTATLSGTINGPGTVGLGANAGTLNLTGTYNVTAATNGLGGTTNFNAPVTSVGPINVSGGTLNFTKAITNNPGSVSIGNGLLNFSTGSPITLGTLTLNSSGAVLAGTDTVTVTGLFTWAGGTLCTTLSAGSCVAPSGSPAILNANGGITGTGGAYYQFLYGRTLNNAGAANFGNTNGYFTYLNFGSAINNQAGATWNQTVDNGYLAVAGTGGTFNNAGTFAKTGGTGTSQVQPVFSNTGTVQVNTGTLSLTGTYTQTAGATLLNGGNLTSGSTLNIQGGTVSGSGTISGTFTGSVSTNPGGAIAPGASSPSPVIGAIALSGTGAGNLSQGTGAYNVKIGGTSTGQYDTLTAAGTATLGGALNVTLINGFTAAVGNSFTILNAATVSGKFGSTNLPALSAGLGWQVTYNSNSVVLSVVAVSSPVATLSAGSLSFPNTLVTTSSAIKTVTLQNTGTAPLTITSIQPTGADGSHYVYTVDAAKPCPISPATLGNGASCTVNVTFAPLSQGTHNNAQITITDDNGGVAGSTQNITVSGTGIVLSSIQITAPNSSIVSGATDQFTATGTYSDNSTANLTAQATWNSATSSVATINANGLATGAQAGTSIITASMSGITSNQVTLTVTPAVATTITSFSGSAQSATVNTAFTNPFIALVRDGANNPVPNVTVTFTAQTNGGATGTFANGTGSTTATTDALGHATSSTFTANTVANAYTVLASVAGVVSSAGFSVSNTAGAANSIAATSGSGQTANISSAFASSLQVTVNDTYGNPVSGVSVTYTAPSTGASATFSNGTNTRSSTTNAQGQIAAAVTANSAAGAYTVTASATGVATPAGFSLANQTGAPASVTVSSGSGQSAGINTTFAASLTVLVRDAGNNPVSGITVTFAAPAFGASGTFAAGLDTATTNAQGLATSAAFTANGTLGGYTVTASVNGVATPASFSLNNTVGTPATISATSGFGQSATISTQFSSLLVATVTDAGGNPVPNVTVTFNAPTSGASGTFAGGVKTAVTNAQGQATSAVFTANGTAGGYTVTASVSGVSTPAGFSLTNRGAATISATSGTPQSAYVGSIFAAPLVVTVADSAGSPVSGVTVTFNAPASGAGGAFAGGVITAITNASGVATSAAFQANTTLGSYTVTASSPGVSTPASFSLTNTVAAPASIGPAAGTTPQSTYINMAFAAKLAAVVLDGFGNPVSGVPVTFTAPSSGASGSFAGGVITVATDSTGTATAPVFSANGTLGTYDVTAMASGISSAAIFQLTNQPGPAAAVTATAGVNQNTTILSSFNTQLTATVLDASNNPVPNVSVTFTAPANGASGTFAGGGASFTGTTDATGSLTAPVFTANAFAGSYTCDCRGYRRTHYRQLPLDQHRWRRRSDCRHRRHDSNHHGQYTIRCGSHRDRTGWQRQPGQRRIGKLYRAPLRRRRNIPRRRLELHGNH